MKSFCKFLAVLFVILVVLASSVSAFAYDYDYDYDNAYSYGFSSGYYIENYNVQLTVNEDNTVRVTEQITADFLTEKHGIYRYIPIKNYIERADGSSARINAKITDLQVNANYTTFTEGGNYVIQIGDEDKTLTGEQKYTVSYTYNIGRDTNEGFDELYYNIIGDGWDTYIDSTEFTITMPKQFDENKLGFSAGVYGTEGNDGRVLYTVDGNTISGTVDNRLEAYEALTVRLELEDDYFTFNYFAYYLKLSLMVIIPLIALLIVFVLWSRHGRDKKIVDVIEFYPPDGMNSAEVALWYKGIAAGEDTVGMLIELANEGYIDIVETDKKQSLFSSVNDYKIIKKKSIYDGHDRLKHKFFNGLFKNGLNYVYISDLEESFYKTADVIVRELNDKKEEIFHSKSLQLRYVGWAVSVVAAVIPVFACIQILGGFEKYIVCAAGVAVAVLAFIMSFFIRQRTDTGHELKQKINGFKIFLETAEKDRLELLVEENPEYFYNILPFAYALDVSDKWIKNFEGIALQKPVWYYGPTYTPMTMYHFMHHAMPMAARAMTSQPNSSGSGSSGGMSFGGGGGGFSGGGFGGGGGGSW